LSFLQPDARQPSPSDRQQTTQLPDHVQFAPCGDYYQHPGIFYFSQHPALPTGQLVFVAAFVFS
jgi:hypothetical protein